MSETTPMPQCPMADMCRGMIESRTSKRKMTVAGLFFVAFGVLILLVPAVLVVLVAALFVTIGTGIILFANRIGRLHHAGGHRAH